MRIRQRESIPSAGETASLGELAQTIERKLGFPLLGDRASYKEWG